MGKPTTYCSGAGLAAACHPFVQLSTFCARQLIEFILYGVIAVSTNWIIQDESHNSLLIVE